MCADSQTWSQPFVNWTRDFFFLLNGACYNKNVLGINKNIIQTFGGIGSHSISLLVTTSSLWRTTGKWDSEADFLKGWMHLWPNTVCRTWSCHLKWYLAKYSLAVAYLKHGIWFLLQLNEGEVDHRLAFLNAELGYKTLCCCC